MTLQPSTHPWAIAMWDFSWLERRWPGGGYENWDVALAELAERGYDTVRIDPYPHLLAKGPGKWWRLQPVWDQHDWGSPWPISVQVEPALTEFMSACARHQIGVALSSWFRQDETDARLAVDSPQKMADVWARTLQILDDAGLLQQVRYVDLSNEFPSWPTALSLREGHPRRLRRTDPDVHQYMQESIGALREKWPGLAYCYSFSEGFMEAAEDISFMDFIELHIWLTHPEVSDFYDRIGYNLRESHFDPGQYHLLAEKAQAAYHENPAAWLAELTDGIEAMAEWSRRQNKPLMTTECWAIVNWKDGPGLDWEWLKEICAAGVRAAVSTGRWAGIATSNFCGPQYVGMWRDVTWHRQLTNEIHCAPWPQSE